MILRLVPVVELYLSLALGNPEGLAMQPRGPILNQTFDTIEYQFGPHLTESSYSQGNETWTERTYPTDGLRQMLPTLPDQTVLKIIFVDGRAQWILLNSSEDDSMPLPDDEAWQSFTYDQVTAAQFFAYIFGYHPITFTPVSGFNGGGHEGFLEHAVCLGDGIQTTYTEYWFGYGDIRLSHNPLCEVP